MLKREVGRSTVLVARFCFVKAIDHTRSFRERKAQPVCANKRNAPRRDIEHRIIWMRPDVLAACPMA